MKTAAKQTEMFAMPAKFTRRGDSIVPPTGEELARAGANAAAANADRVSPEWTDRAYFLFAAYARGHAEFATEDVVSYATTLGFAAPPDKRAWGHVAKRAAKARIVERSGYTKAKNSNVHRMTVTLWRSLVARG